MNNLSQLQLRTVIVEGGGVLKTEWNYSERAHTYDKRADYSAKAISSIIEKMLCLPSAPIADIGAGTGKLTKMLAEYSLSISAVEPNDNMRMYGKKNTIGLGVNWIEGTGENTGLPSSSYQAVFFGSSFNVVNQYEAIAETARILRPNGWLVCIWNH